nr:MAG: hypothetical protein DIU70_02325 [Bacillota bacterium]
MPISPSQGASPGPRSAWTPRTVTWAPAPSRTGTRRTRWAPSRAASIRSSQSARAGFRRTTT